MAKTVRGRVVLYTADQWGHVCPFVRVIGPYRMLGWEVIPGAHWESGSISIFPEKVMDADIVVIQRDFPRFTAAYREIVELARRKGKLIVYDLDDLLTELPKEHPDLGYYQPARVPILHAVLDADVVTCPTLMLKEYLAQFAANLVVLPNYLNDEVWGKALRAKRNNCVEEGDPVIIGYMGTHSHAHDLEMIVPALIKILRRYGDKIKLRFWGCPPPPRLRSWRNVEWIDLGIVNYAEFASYFSEQYCDIFIAPLVDSAFNNCKSALKFLEYSITGVPGVYSAVGQFKEIVVHGENGFLAEDLKDWQEYLSQLIEDNLLRRQVGKRAFETVTERWILYRHAEEWMAFHREMLSYHRTDSQSQIARIPIPFITKVEAWDQENLIIIDKIVKEAAAEASAREQLLLEKEQEIKRLSDQLNAILTSPGWRLVEVLGRVRNRIVPRGTKREQILFAMLQRLCKPVKREESLGETLLFEGTPCVVPSISIILPKGSNFPTISPVSLQEWVASQTYTGVETVVWEAEKGVAYTLDNPDKKWPALSTSALLESLRGKYICLASQDLLQMPETYLEANLIALESENLIFTVNSLGYNTVIERRVPSGRLPGNSQMPLLRQVVRRENVRGEFRIELSESTQERNAIVGKIIVHPTSYKDKDYAVPFNSEVQGTILRLQGDKIMTYSPNPLAGKKESRVIYSVHTVVPIIPTIDDDKPTVFVVMPFLAVGGAERVALDVLYYLQKHIRFVVVTTEHHEPSLGTTVDEFRQITPYVYTLADWVSPALRLSCLEYLIQRFRPVTIYIANGSQFIYETMLPAIKQQHAELRVVNQVYDHRMGWISYYKNGTLVSNIDAHIGCNQKICQAYIRYGAPAERVYLIPHGVDVDLFDPRNYPLERRISIKKQMGLPTEQKIITFMGRLHPQKRPMDFVEMARRSAYNHLLFFLMVGDGPSAGAVDAEVQRIGLKNFERRPFSFAPDVLATSDVIVLPSEYEGMPMVVLEAQAMGKPVVVTDVGANREIIGSTRGGVIVSKIGDISALLRGVNEMLQNPPDSARVREIVAKKFNIRDIAEQYQRVLLGE